LIHQEDSQTQWWKHHDMGVYILKGGGKASPN
jgi:hypothetical protein